MRESEKHNKYSQKSKQIQFIIAKSFASDDRMRKIMFTGLFHILKLLKA